MKTKFVMASLLAVAVFSITVTPNVSASNSPTHASEADNHFDLSDGVWWGYFSQDAATDDGRSFGGHASSSGGFVSEPGSDGLGNLSQFTGSWCDLLEFLGFACL
ncbi:MAG: hypothetical protein KC444_05735 [Nitrosopumilus sp.]|nr:hypothetical protein [Nitrosopumilus sp.]